MKVQKLTLFIAVGILLLVNAPKVSAAGTFAISPASGSYLRSCNQSVDIVIDVTSGQSNAADVILNYDVSKIEIIDALPSIPGVQILPGNAFESYAGNSVNTATGEIKIVGYSSMGTLQNSATFASIKFKSKPLATNGSFNFTFTGANPYNTLDSNIADAVTSYDMLSGVTNGGFTFNSGSCATDTTPPQITFVSPKNLANNVPPASPVTFTIADSGSGVDLSSLHVSINGTVYTAISPEVTVTGTPANYSITILPSTPFVTNTLSVISVTVSDASGNTKNSNISINSSYSCPVTYITKPGSCTTTDSPTPTPTPRPDRTSPVITVVSATTIDLRKVFTLKFRASDNKGISPESFSLNIGKHAFTLASTPERVKVEGSKDNYTFTIDLKPEEMETNDEGKLVGLVKISDLEGNTRLEQLLFSTIGKAVGDTTTKSVRTWQDELATTIVYYAAPLMLVISMLIVSILSAQPTVAYIVDPKSKPVRFPRGYYLHSNGQKQKLFGNFTGKLHGRIPQEDVKLVVQKYGYATQSIQLSPLVKHEPKRIVLSRL